MCRTRLASLAFVLALGFIAFAASTASAVDYHWKSVVVVPPGIAPDDLHISYAGTGGTIGNVTVDPAPTSAGPSGAGNTISVVWPAKLAPGTRVTLRFTTQFAPVLFMSGIWTNGGNTIGNVTPDMVQHTWETTAGVPGASPAVMALLALLIAGAGARILLRRRAAA